jgi:large subunit ribosomal protein L9
MSKNVKLLLTENVESLGIVGDVVNVRVGYARNFLLPRSLATTPSDEMIQAVASKRAEAQKQLAELRKQREALVKKLEGIEITMVRSCNDLGHLYASVTQQEIATALAEAGHPGVRPRDVRLNMSIKRVDNYDIHIKFENELEATIKLHVNPDRKLDLDKAREAEAEAQAADAAAAAAAAVPAERDEAESVKGDKKSAEKPAGERKSKGTKDAGDAKPDKPAKSEKPKKERGEGKGDKSSGDAPAAKKSEWGKVVDQGPADMPIFKPRRDKGDKKRG